MRECCRAGPVHPLIPDLLPFCGMIETYIGDRFAVPHRVHVVVTIVFGAKRTLGGMVAAAAFGSFTSLPPGSQILVAIPIDTSQVSP